MNLVIPTDPAAFQELFWRAVKGPNFSNELFVSFIDKTATDVPVATRRLVCDDETFENLWCLSYRMKTHPHWFTPTRRPELPSVDEIFEGPVPLWALTMRGGSDSQVDGPSGKEEPTVELDTKNVVERTYDTDTPYVSFH